MKRILLAFSIIFLIGGTWVGYLVVMNRYFPYRNIKTELRAGNLEPVLSIHQPISAVHVPDINTFQHLVLTLNGQDQWRVDNWNILEEIEPEIPVLITIELWDRGVLQKMKAGAYNEKLRALFTLHLAEHKNLYLRWNPEMEVPYTGLPWGNRGSSYPEAFKKFAGLCQEILPNSKIVWGPAGFSGLMENYPGRDYLDMASITLNSEFEKELEKGTIPIREQLKRKLHRMRFLQVPVLILGSKNTNVKDFQKTWVTIASEEIKQEKKEINFKNILPFKEHDIIPKRKEKLQMGVFDPNELLVNEPEVSVEHIFISFKHIQDGSYIQELSDIFSRKHDAIITVEPGGLNNNKKEDETILKNILDGEFDDLIKVFYENLPKTDHTIYLRFAHEMEIPINRYPWQSQDPIEYIKAYRYFMHFPEKEQPNIKKVWGPAGDRGLLEWWPGEDAVDVISIAIYGLPDKNITDPEKQESFSQIYRRKNGRINLLNKPLFITEFGVKGDEEFQDNWLINAARVIKSEPNIIGVCYFNREDVPEAWGDIQPPQWQISNKTFNKFVEELKPTSSSIKAKAPAHPGL